MAISARNILAAVAGRTPSRGFPWPDPQETNVGDHCPKCSSTTIGHTIDGQCMCVDCEFTWQPGGKKNRPRRGRKTRRK